MHGIKLFDDKGVLSRETEILRKKLQEISDRKRDFDKIRTAGKLPSFLKQRRGKQFIAPFSSSCLCHFNTGRIYRIQSSVHSSASFSISITGPICYNVPLNMSLSFEVMEV
ncbi:hypothetical protein AVEN_13323-1 [Araneus ventricosus]|uniref:Uncharacterized protein n=1 Tax=Araneus ventricosus TaxID=182803 RepID=A0A4Y2HE09_ARAVE|nr:hypothetical protein AVEN_13323-1 [Araneus ventricosus]